MTTAWEYNRWLLGWVQLWFNSHRIIGRSFYFNLDLTFIHLSFHCNLFIRCFMQINFAVVVWILCCCWFFFFAMTKWWCTIYSQYSLHLLFCLSSPSSLFSSPSYSLYIYSHAFANDFNFFFLGFFLFFWIIYFVNHKKRILSLTIETNVELQIDTKAIIFHLFRC